MSAGSRDELGEEAVVREPEVADHHEADEEADDLGSVSQRVPSPLGDAGIPMPTTSSVIAIANTASLKNATRSNSSPASAARSAPAS